MVLNKYKLQDCCLSISDGDHQPPPKAERGIPFVTISNIDSSNQFDFNGAMHVPQDYYDGLDDKRKPREKDILYSVVGSFGIPVYMKEEKEFVFQRHIAILRPDEEKIVPKYLYYTMLSKDFYAKADAAAVGAAQRTVSLTALRNMEISIPDYDVQVKIANVLSAYDDLIENNQKQIKLLEEAAQRLYKEWFVDLRFPDYENTKIIDGVPEGWEKCAISTLGEFINGFAFKPSDWSTNGKPIIKIKEMGNGITSDTPRNDGSRVPDKYLVKTGDVLFSWSATLMVMIWNQEEAWLNQHIFKVIPAEGIAREFVLQSIRSTIELFRNLTTGSTMKHIQRGKLDQVYIGVPDCILMGKYQSVSEPIREQILRLSSMNTGLIEARDRLLPKLMSGEIEV